jgi:hypothetical protein
MFDFRNEQNYNGSAAVSFGPQVRKTVQNYQDYMVLNGGGVQFRVSGIEDESGVYSPPLWKTSPPRSPVHVRQNTNYQYMSPASRTQAIAKGQVELMEMVKNMPESSYELSLKDLVDHNIKVQQDHSKDQESLVDKKKTGFQKAKSKGKVTERKVSMTRSGSIDHTKGMFIHMRFPNLSFRSKNKKKHKASNPFARVSPKPEGEKVVLKKTCFLSEHDIGVNDWWKKRFSVLSESESGVTSSNSDSKSSRNSSSNGSPNNNIRYVYFLIIFYFLYNLIS